MQSGNKLRISSAAERAIKHKKIPRSELLLFLTEATGLANRWSVERFGLSGQNEGIIGESTSRFVVMNFLHQTRKRSEYNTARKHRFK